MESWTIRVAYFIMLLSLVSSRFGSCAPHSEEGRVLLRYRERERDKTTGSLSNCGEGKVIGRVLNLFLKENMFASGTPCKLKERGTISESSSASSPISPSDDPMATASVDQEDDDFQEDDDDDDLDDEDDDQESSPSPSDGADEARLESVLRRLTAEEVRIRVHDVEIRGCCRTRRAAVEVAVGSDLARAATVRDLVRAAAAAGDRIRRLGAFDTVSITLDAAPPGIPGSAAVIVLVDVAEARGRAAGELGIFANAGTRSCSVEGSVKLKNLFGYCETWDASGDLGLDQTVELSTGVAIPRIGAIPTPLVARISFLSEDWLKSSLKEHMMGVSVGLLSTMNHNLAYNLSWRTITDRALMSSNSIRGQLGHSLLSSIKYAYKVDQRDSRIRPTQGYAYLFSSQVGGLAPESKDARYVRQELDLRVALPLGVLNGALNAGVAAGIIHPLARGSTGSISPLSEQFYLGGNRSLMCRMGGPSSLLGFKKRGLRTDLRSSTPENSESVASTSPELGTQEGDIAVTAFADLSFDIPLKPLRELGIHGHAFVSAGNLAKLAEPDLRKFPLADFLQTFRSSAGFGVVVPTRLFRIEVNYCHILKQFDHDIGKAGIQFNFSSP
uniref:Bacterial surface antigen (D15) domain-containing protein n=1 Tax=Oryza punctata TaxID=4537 RepID=A0A0E0MBI4_ORYPU